MGPPGRDWGLQAGIRASWLGFGPRGWDLGLEAGIRASRLGFESGREGTEEKEKEEEEKKKEKFPLCVKA